LLTYGNLDTKIKLSHYTNYWKNSNCQDLPQQAEKYFQEGRQGLTLAQKHMFHLENDNYLSISHDGTTFRNLSIMSPREEKCS
jgi:hypothetical protein